MKVISLALLTLFSTTCLASEVTCSIKVNTQQDTVTKFKIEENERVKFGSADNLTFFLKRLTTRDFELELLDVNIPSRSYAKATLEKSSDHLQYSYWSREMLLEAECNLID